MRIAGTGAALLFLAAVGWAQVMPTVTLTPLSPSFEVHGPNQIPFAQSFAGEPDTWVFDTSAFASPVLFTVAVADWFPLVPDDYDVFGNDVLLGNTWTGSASIGRTFQFQSSGPLTSVRVEYVNRFSGIPTQPDGSYYDLNVIVQTVPEPATGAVLGLSLLAFRKRRP